MNSQRFFVPFRAPSVNTIFKHWTVYDKNKNIMEPIVRQALAKYNIEQIPDDCVVNIIFQPIFKKKGNSKTYDMVNYAGNIKIIEDWLVKLKILKNDDNKNVVSHKTNNTIVQDKHETGMLVILTWQKREEYKVIDKHFLNMI